jgi:2-C-methyl-D-erythritol 4-phosphate cytidylyltransferase
MAKTAVIIVAAGKGERFGGSEKKTFAKLDGRPMFLRTLEQFINREDVCQTLLVVAPEDMDELKSKYGANLGFMGVKVAQGGAERHDSVFNGLSAIIEEAEYVAVHDAARPCVAPEMIDRVFAEAAKTGAAILAAPLRGTIKRVSGSMVIDETLSREGLWEAQTPQVFRKSVLVEAYARRAEFAGAITDDAQLIEATGHPVSVVESDFTNLKVTAKADLTLANAILKNRPALPARGRLGAFEEAQW